MVVLISNINSKCIEWMHQVCHSRLELKWVKVYDIRLLHRLVVTRLCEISSVFVQEDFKWTIANPLLCWYRFRDFRQYVCSHNAVFFIYPKLTCFAGNLMWCDHFESAKIDLSISWRTHWLSCAATQRRNNKCQNVLVQTFVSCASLSISTFCFHFTAHLDIWAKLVILCF